MLTDSIALEHGLGLQEDLLELAAFCPFDHTNPDDCPLFPLRKMRVKDRLMWLKALTEQDLGYLTAYHDVCFKTKSGTKADQAAD